MKLDMLRFEDRRLQVGAARGMTSASWAYVFSLPGLGDEDTFVRLTAGLDVTFLQVRVFTDASLLILYFTGDPVRPQYVVAEFAFDNVNVRHLKDHGDDIIAAHADFTHRKPGEMTTRPPGAAESATG